MTLGGFKIQCQECCCRYESNAVHSPISRVSARELPRSETDYLKEEGQGDASIVSLAMSPDEFDLFSTYSAISASSGN